MNNEQITRLIDQRKSVSLVARHQETATQLWARHRDYYFQALNSGVISLLCSLAKEGGNHDGPRRYWQGMFKDRTLAISVYPENILRVEWNENTICSNEQPGQEFIIPDDWILFCREAFEQIESDRAEKSRLAEAERQHQQQQRALREHQETVQILSVFES